MPKPMTLLTILPDVAYIAQMKKGSKEHTFAVESFKQVNGSFIKNGVLVPKNILKLFEKLEKTEYAVVLPDDLATNAIISVEETTESKVSEYIEKTTLPSLGITPETHQVKHFTLTQFKGTSRVQLSAFEKEVLAPLRAAATQFELPHMSVVTISWAAKSLVSLEPSVTLVQMGGVLYSALQYIGIDQTAAHEIDDLDAVAESIKTLKGSEPSTQTVYLLTNELVEETLTEALSSTIPLQQLAEHSDKDVDMPSFVQKMMEVAMKSLAIPDYSVPQFALEAATEKELEAFVAGNLEEPDEHNKDAGEDTEKQDDDVELASDTSVESDTEDTSIPTPTTPAEVAAASAVTSVVTPVVAGDASTDTSGTKQDESDTKDQEDSSEPLAIEEVGEGAQNTDAKVQKEEADQAEEQPPSALEIEDATEQETAEPKKESTIEIQDKTVKEITVDDNKKNEDTDKQDQSDADEEIHAPLELGDDQSAQKSELDTTEEDVNIAQFAHAESSEDERQAAKTSPPVVKKPVIKNETGTKNMVKLLSIVLIVFLVTVGVGVGVGFLFIRMKAGDVSLPTSTPTPVVEVVSTPDPSPEPTPEASESAQVTTSELDVLILNATSTAGYASSTKADMPLGEYNSIDTGNATGEYEPGMYLLTPEDNPELLEQLSADSGLELVAGTQEEYNTEDPSGEYNAVIVLAE
ncbi:MAG: hypothetical protein H6774_03235 [Pseudomonadales bacterium]|nr:hypothetical protein [Pseudomonadales bacterium]